MIFIVLGLACNGDKESIEPNVYINCDFETYELNVYGAIETLSYKRFGSYDENGNLIEELYDEGNTGVIDMISVFTYEDNLLQSMTSESPEAGVFSRVVKNYYYDNTNTIERIDTILGEYTQVDNRHHFVYDENKFIVEEYMVYGSSQRFYQLTQQWTETDDGWDVLKSVDENGNGLNEAIHTIQADKKGNFLFDQMELDSDEDTQLDIMTDSTYSYTDSGKIAHVFVDGTIISNQGDSSFYTEEHQYTYDSQGRQTQFLVEYDNQGNGEIDAGLRQDTTWECD